MKENITGLTLANRYHISELIGTGGMASVYKGECNLLNRDVAIKVLRDSVKDDVEALTSFKNEAQAAASLNHNNIVSVFDIGEENGIDYMVMEYVKGITLKKYILDKGPLPWQEVCDFGIQICQALEAAHNVGIIHRDIKPQNILMTDDLELKVTDFGIAKAATSETLTAGGSAMGSVHYISPEQARGGYTDVRSDIYSLGIVLFEMITGTVPFNAESAVSVALMHIEKEIPSVLYYSRSIPEDLSKVIAKATAKEQASRYQSVTDLITDLRAVLASEPLENMDSFEDDEIGHTKKFRIDDDFDDDDLDDEPVKNKKNKKKNKTVKTEEEKQADKRATLLAFLTVFILILIGFGGYYLLKHRSGEVMVPDFYNMTIEEATELAEKKNVLLSEELEYSLSDEIDEGKIISQSPEAKSYIGKSEPVHLVVSIGSSGGDINAPFVKGIPIEEGIEKIVNAGLTYIINEEPSNTIPNGRIIRQSPEVGTKLNENDVITLHVSTGRVEPSPTPITLKKVSMPSLYGYTQAEAEIEAANAGLKLISVSKKDSDAPEGTVISQSPEQGKEIPEGTGISIVLSTGISTTETFTPPTISAPETESATEEPVDEEEGPYITQDPNEQYVTKLYTFQMPEGEGTAKVIITIDGDVFYEKEKEYGDVISVDIQGTGKRKLITYVNGQIEDEMVLDLELE